MVQNLSQVKQVTSQLDFSYLNDVWSEFQTLPTTEHIARYLAAAGIPLTLSPHPVVLNFGPIIKERNGRLPDN